MHPLREPSPPLSHRDPSGLHRAAKGASGQSEMEWNRCSEVANPQPCRACNSRSGQCREWDTAHLCDKLHHLLTLCRWQLVVKRAQVRIGLRLTGPDLLHHRAGLRPGPRDAQACVPHAAKTVGRFARPRP
eukprot:scaffold46238_cov270-Isochrysis_galbana.AAC.2